MVNYYFYILFSKQIDKFYIGHTNNLDERLKKHNTKHKGCTVKVNDWEIIIWKKGVDYKAINYKKN